MTPHNCFYCGPTEKELRPYGPDGAPVCYDCAFATPERRIQTDKEHDAHVERVATELAEAVERGDHIMGIVIGGEEGAQILKVDKDE